jgi:hypothetical protein
MVNEIIGSQGEDGAAAVPFFEFFGFDSQPVHGAQGGILKIFSGIFKGTAGIIAYFHGISPFLIGLSSFL